MIGNRRVQAERTRRLGVLTPGRLCRRVHLAARPVSGIETLQVASDTSINGTARFGRAAAGGFRQSGSDTLGGDGENPAGAERSVGVIAIAVRTACGVAMATAFSSDTGSSINSRLAS